MYTKSQKLVAEFIGTFALIFFGAGSICADQFLHSTGQGGLGLLGIALAHGLAIGFWVTKRLTTFDAILYWIAQLAGAVAAAYLLRTIIPLETWRNAALGTPELAHDFTRSYAIVLEAVMTFFLVFVVFATAVDERGAFNKIAGFAIGLTITMDILMGGPLTGAAMNPARAFGPALAAKHWANHGVYWVGPLAGGFLAGLFYDSLYLKKP